VFNEFCITLVQLASLYNIMQVQNLCKFFFCFTITTLTTNTFLNNFSVLSDILLSSVHVYSGVFVVKLWKSLSRHIQSSKNRTKVVTFQIATYLLESRSYLQCWDLTRWFFFYLLSYLDENSEDGKLSKIKIIKTVL